MQGTATVPRCGPVDTKLRMHFVLQLPPHDAAGITVGQTFRKWKEGEAVLFDESMEHTVSSRP